MTIREAVDRTLLSKLVNKTLSQKGFWHEFREAVTILVISGCFECLEDLSHFLAPLVGVGAVHPAGRHL
ncbi:hypothetical protein RKD49_000113 [Streptomyces glaucescens]